MSISTDTHDNFKTRYPDSDKPDASVAVQFLKEIANRGPMTIALISVGGATRARTFDMSDAASIADMRSFIAFAETTPSQVFYLPGIAKPGHGIPSNEDMLVARAVVLDFDPAKDLPLEQERERLRGVAHMLIEGPLQPRAVVDTGGGMQVVYQLLEPMPLDSEEARSEYETLVRSLARSHGADTATCTAKNLFRVPGTYNWPTPAKKKAGRERTVSGVWHIGGPKCSRTDLQALCTITPEDIAAVDVDFEGVTEQDVLAVLRTPEALPGHIIDRLRGDPVLTKAILEPDEESGDRSGDDYQLCMTLARFRLPPADMALILSAYGAKVQETHEEGRLFSYVIGRVRKALAHTAPERFHTNFQDEAAEAEQQARVKQHLGRLVPLSMDQALEGLFDQNTNTLVEGFMQRREVTVIYGKSGSGKTFVTLDLLYSVSLGKPWNNRKTAQCDVVYIAAESPLGVRYRLKALQDKYGPNARFYLVPATINLFDANVDLKPLIDNIARLEADVGIIAIDTLARVMLGGNENSTQDMSRLVANGDILRDRFGANVVWVHHTGKDTSLGARGSSALVAATDTELEISGTAGSGVLRVTKMRDRDPFDYKFKLHQVRVGAFPSGEEVTSCTIDWVGAPAAQGLPSTVTTTRDMVMHILRLIGQPATLSDIMGAAKLYNVPLTVGRAAVQVMLTRSCNSDVEKFFTRTQRGTPAHIKNSKRVEFVYGLYDESVI